jgi:hypothetical protein
MKKNEMALNPMNRVITPRSARPGLKAKFIAQYELLLTPHVDLFFYHLSDQTQNNVELPLDSDNFWEELFLLRVESSWITQWVQAQKPEYLQEIEVDFQRLSFI